MAEEPEDQGQVATEDIPGGEEEKKERLEYQVDITDSGPCQKHLRVTVPRKEIDRYFDKEFTDLLQNANIPGFRKGKTPRRLIEKKFQKDVGKQVKTAVIMQSLEQIGEEQKIEPLSEPNLNVEAIDLPEDGDFTYEFDVEVRPEFDLPEYKGLKVQRPVREFTDADIDKELDSFLLRIGTQEPKDGPAEMGDYIEADIRFMDAGEVLNEVTALKCRIDEDLLFRDGSIAGFGKAMVGVRAGDSRDLKAKIGASVNNERMRNKELTAVFVVNEVSRLIKPELNEELFDRLDVSDLGELRDVMRARLERRLKYAQQRSIRDQILGKLVEGTNFELPPALLRRQAERTFRKVIFELQNAGYSEEDIRARVNLLRQDSIASTSKSLKQQFVLQRIAETEDVKVEDEDLDRYIENLAEESDESVRRVRSRIEKEGLWEAIALQVVEQKTLDKIMTSAEMSDTPYQEEQVRSAGLDESAVPDTHEAEEPSAGEAENKEGGAPKS